MICGRKTILYRYGTERNNQMIETILKNALAQGASDLFILPGAPIQMKIKGQMQALDDRRIMPQESWQLIQEIYEHSSRPIDTLTGTGDDFSFSLPQTGRFRCNAYRQRNSFASVIRIIPFGLPDFRQMHIPEQVIDLSTAKSGMILVTGPAGSGKSTTLACMIEAINTSRPGHIITLEDPIEFIYSHKKCLVSQREIEPDTRDYATALRAALRQTPDTILLGEMRDFSTIQTAVTAAETGQLILSTLHTLGAAKTIDRIIDSFPYGSREQIRVQLSMVLKAVVSQQLVPSEDGTLIPVFEIMIVTPAIANLIREGKIHQIDNVIYSNRASGMRTMDGSLLDLYQQGIISKETAIAYAQDKTMMTRRMSAERV